MGGFAARRGVGTVLRVAALCCALLLVAALPSLSTDVSFPKGCLPLQALDTTPPIGRETYPSYRLYHFHCEFKRFDELADLAAPPLHLGLWLPPSFDPASETAKTRPAVVYVHSGGWQAGTINEIYTHFSGLGGPNGLIEGLQNTTDPDNAPVLVAVTYRLTSAGWLYGADNVVWPAQLHDVMDAIRWVRANAASLQIDPSRIGCMGLSSGAHICAHAALRGSEDQQTHLAAAMLFAPPLTFGSPVPSTWYSLPRNFNLHCCCDRVNATGNCHSCDVVVGTPFEGRLPYCEHEGTYDKPLAVQPGNKYEDFYSSPQLTLLLGASPLAVVAHQTDPDPAWMALNARLRDLDPLARDPGERPLPSFYTIHGKEDFVARYELGGPRLHSALMDLPDADKREDVLVSIEGMGHLVSEEYEPVYRQAVLRGMQWFEERLLQARAAEPTHKKKKKKKKKKFCEAAKSKKACKKVKGCSFTKKKGCRAICKAAKSKKACKKVKGCSFTKKKGCRAI